MFALALLRISPELFLLYRSNQQVRLLFQYRFLYMCTVHVPVLVPLLNDFGGIGLTLLSLGVASGVVAILQGPAGWYADNVGPKRALAWGTALIAGVTLGFFVLGMCRLWLTPGAREQPLWWPGVVGMFVLEVALGAALALIMGADTLLFRDVLYAQAIPQDQLSALEGFGSAVRYYGAMAAVGLGSIYYFLFSVDWALLGDSTRRSFQFGIFLMSALIQFLALDRLTRLSAPHAPGRAPRQLRQLRDAIWDVTGRASVSVALWICCLVLGTETFVAYYFQAPLTKVTEQLIYVSMAFLPFYAIVMMLSRWASARGSLLFHRLAATAAPQHSGGEAIGICAALAALTVLFVAATPNFGKETTVGFAVTCIGVVVYGGLRGLLEPYARILLIQQAGERGIRNSLLGLFGVAQRIVHLTLSGIFFVGGLFAQSHLNFVGLMGIAVALTVAMVGGVAFLGLSRPRSSSLAPLESGLRQVILIGSHPESCAGLEQVKTDLMNRGVNVLGPISAAVSAQSSKLAQRTAGSVPDLQQLEPCVLSDINRADVVLLYADERILSSFAATAIDYTLKLGKSVIVTTSLNEAVVHGLSAGLHRDYSSRSFGR